MFGFDHLVSIVMAVAMLFSPDFDVASIFPSWTQYLLSAPTEPFSQESSPVEDLPVIEAVTTVINHTVAPTVSSLSKALAIIPKTAPSAAPSFSDLAKQIISALYTHLIHPIADPATLLFLFLVGVLLLTTTIAYSNCSPPIMKQQDLIQLEAQIIQRDDFIEEMRAAHAATVADLHDKLQAQAEKARIAHATASLHHEVERAEKDREIRILNHKLEWSGHMETKARYESDDKVVKLEKEIDHLRLVVDTLEDKLESAGELINAAEEADDKVKAAEFDARAAVKEAHEANDKVTAANERALIATQKTQEANMKVTAAEKACEAKVEAAIKANKEKIAGERQNAQAAIDKLLADIQTQRNKVRVEEDKVEDLKRENKELAAKARAVADAPSLPSFTSRSSAQAAEETRRRLQALSGQESPCSRAATPAGSTSAAVAVVEPEATPATAPATTTQPKVPRTVWKAAAMPNPVQLVRKKVKGPFDR